MPRMELLLIYKQCNKNRSEWEQLFVGLLFVTKAKEKVKNVRVSTDLSSNDTLKLI